MENIQDLHGKDEIVRFFKKNGISSKRAELSADDFLKNFKDGDVAVLIFIERQQGINPPEENVRQTQMNVRVYHN